MVALQERNFSTSSDMYKGHKVVAMPSSGAAPLSVRDVVTTRSTFDANRPRSKSAGRATTRSRDIVQEVYDRMGVNRGDETPAFDDDPFKTNEQVARPTTPGRERGDRSPESAEKFSQRYRAAAALSSPRASNERGRGAEQQDGSSRRCRSLSRGRAVAGRWPPARNDSEQQPVPQPVPTFLPKKTEDSSVASSVAPLSPKTNRSRTYSRSDSQEEMNTESDSSSPKEEKTVSSSVPSVKDRINVYAGRNSSRNFPQKKPVHYQTYTSQKRPAPINIYEEARSKQESPPKVEESNDAPGVLPEPSAVPPSPAAAAAADAAFAYVRGGSSSRSVKSAGPLRSTTTPRGTTGIAGTYLGAIKSPNNTTTNKSSPGIQHQSTTSAPLTEISAADPAGDGHSVAASSVSADEYNFTSQPSRSVGGVPAKKSSWAERNKPQVSPTGRNNTNGSGGGGGSQYTSTNGSSNRQPTTPSANEIEKMVEQRVKARVSVVEMRMEEQMQRLERRVEEKLNARIGMLDEKIDKMNSMLAMLLSRELSASDSERREFEI